MRTLPTVLALLVLGAAPAVARAADDPVATTRFSDLGTTDTAVQGTVATATTFLPLRPGYAPAGGSIDLAFEHSALLRADRSTVTILANGVPLGSTRLTRGNAEGGRLRVRMPALPDAQDGVVIAARFSMRLTRDPCEDSRNAALWARVRGTSTVTTRWAPARRTLGEALANLAPGTGAQPLPIAIAGDASDALPAAGVVAAAFGREAADGGEDPLVDAAAPADGGGVTVATADALTAQLRAFDAPAPPADRGVLATTTQGAPRLLVGGVTGADARRAAAALLPGSLAPADGRVAVPTAAAPAAPRRTLPWREDAASFAQLGLGPREVTGPGVATLDLVIDRPPQWVVDGTPALDLVVDADAGLRRTSSVSVTVAGQPFGSRRLSPGAGPTRIHLELPGGIIDRDLRGRAVRSIPVRLRFDLQVDQRGCEPLDIDAARAVVSGASSLTIPHRDTDDRDLSRWPAPLAVPGRPVDVVVPEDASPAERTAGLQLATSIGRWADPAAPAPRLIDAGRLSRAARDGHALVLVGGADRALGRPVADPVADALPPGAGSVILAPSPWGDGDIAAVHGDDAGIVRAARALTSAASIRRLAGRAVRVLPGAGAQATAVARPQGEPPPILAPVRADDDDGLPVWTIPSAVVLLALLALGAVIARRRWGRAARS